MPGTRSGPAAEGRVPNTDCRPCVRNDPNATLLLSSSYSLFERGVYIRRIRGCGNVKIEVFASQEADSRFPQLVEKKEPGVENAGLSSPIFTFSHPVSTRFPPIFPQHFHSVGGFAGAKKWLQTRCARWARCPALGVGPDQVPGAGAQDPVPGMGRLGDSMGFAPESRPYCPIAFIGIEPGSGMDHSEVERRSWRMAWRSCWRRGSEGRFSSIFRMAYMTVVWCLPPKAWPISLREASR